ncbi:MAG: hypothetical protein QGG36_08420 [Pirellulaceae bacterium]|jgi:hypothetical protein|nr:hypothetical protein [Pirellulaceae bacterium]
MRSLTNANLNDTIVDRQDRNVAGINSLRAHGLHQRAPMCAYPVAEAAAPAKAIFGNAIFGKGKSAGHRAASSGSGVETGPWPQWLTLTLVG